ncbi:hypothetical protein E2C01_089641 [Portunus trituberculatus]|uniref:Uncharacterized protein n=1 Tax=Portunus trituberculatus TaxID=210409 RepID=A0A5B7JHT0_PORTR|nr:hypothetical protein [Portunus trituberculatus]
MAFGKVRRAAGSSCVGVVEERQSHPHSALLLPRYSQGLHEGHVIATSLPAPPPLAVLPVAEAPRWAITKVQGRTFIQRGTAHGCPHAPAQNDEE